MSTKVIPVAILNNLNEYNFSHFTVEETIINFLTGFDYEMEKSVHRVFDCYSCSINQTDEMYRECVRYNLSEQYILYSNSALMNFNVDDFVKNLLMKCSCCYTHSFFTPMNIDFYNDPLINVFTN